MRARSPCHRCGAAVRRSSSAHSSQACWAPASRVTDPGRVPRRNSTIRAVTSTATARLYSIAPLAARPRQGRSRTDLGRTIDRPAHTFLISQCLSFPRLFALACSGPCLGAGVKRRYGKSLSPEASAAHTGAGVRRYLSTVVHRDRGTYPAQMHSPGRRHDGRFHTPTLPTVT